MNHPRAESHIPFDQIEEYLRVRLQDFSFSEAMVNTFGSRVQDLISSQRLPPHLWCAEFSMIVARILQEQSRATYFVLTYSRNPHVMIEITENQESLYVEMASGKVEFLSAIPEKYGKVLKKVPYQGEETLCELFDWKEKPLWFIYCMLHAPIKGRDYYANKATRFNNKFRSSIEGAAL